MRIVAALVNLEGDDAGREAVTVVNVGRDRVAPSGWKLQDWKAKQSHSLGERRCCRATPSRSSCPPTRRSSRTRAEKFDSSIARGRR